MALRSSNQTTVLPAPDERVERGAGADAPSDCRSGLGFASSSQQGEPFGRCEIVARRLAPGDVELRGAMK
jgi:hypothetical protein